MEPHEKLYRRIIAQLDRAQLDFLDKMEKDAFFSTGKKLSKSQILSVLVEVLINLNINGLGINSSTELKKRILEGLKYNHEKVESSLKGGAG